MVVNTGELAYTSQAKMGSGEDRWVSQQNNRTRVQWRQNSCAECSEDGKWALCMHTICVHTPHTHTWRTAKLSDKTHKHWIHPHYLRKLQVDYFFFLATSQHRTITFTAKPNCTHHGVLEWLTLWMCHPECELCLCSIPPQNPADITRTSFPETIEH